MDVDYIHNYIKQLSRNFLWPWRGFYCVMYPPPYACVWPWTPMPPVRFQAPSRSKVKKGRKIGRIQFF